MNVSQVLNLAKKNRKFVMETTIVEEKMTTILWLDQDETILILSYVCRQFPKSNFLIVLRAYGYNPFECWGKTKAKRTYRGCTLLLKIWARLFILGISACKFLYSPVVTLVSLCNDGLSVVTICRFFEENEEKCSSCHAKRNRPMIMWLIAWIYE